MSLLPEANVPKQIVRWFTRPVLPCLQFPAGLAGCLVIHRDGVDDAMYEVVVNSNVCDLQKPSEPLVIRGWRVLGRKRGARVYDVCFEPGHEGCDCPDGTYRPERPCKHWCGLKEGLTVIGLPLHGLVRITCPGDVELLDANGKLPTHWFARPEQRPDGTWTIVATYHFDVTLRVSADTVDELVPLVLQAERERLDKYKPAAQACVAPQRALRYVNVRVANQRRRDRFTRAVRGETDPPDA